MYEIYILQIYVHVSNSAMLYEFHEKKSNDLPIIYYLPK